MKDAGAGSADMSIHIDGSVALAIREKDFACFKEFRPAGYDDAVWLWHPCVSEGSVSGDFGVDFG